MTGADRPAPVTLETLQTGRALALEGDGRRSAIAKAPAPAPWRIGALGAEGDEQADLSVHGGPDKALHHYPGDHHAAWRADLGDHPLLGRPGAFGENIGPSGWTEADVRLGDVIRVGGVTLQISQGRQPCWKLSHRFGVEDLAYRVTKTGRTGWYYRVLEGGAIEPGAAMTVIERPSPDWPVARAAQLLLAEKRPDRAALEALAGLPHLAAPWIALARSRLSRAV